MLKIRDRVALGALAGLIATIPQLLLDALLVGIGFSRYFGFQLAASVYLYRHLTEGTWGMLLGAVVWELLAAGLGILTAYVIHWTGRDFWWMKALLVSSTLMFVFLYGFFYALGAPRIVPWDLATNWSVLLENLVFSVATGYLVTRWGEYR